MPQNLVLSRLLPAALAVATRIVAPFDLVSAAPSDRWSARA
jgi:hypothetical protein